jgi:hypothetical protein
VITIFCVRPTGFNIGNDTIFVGLRHLVRQAFGEPVNLVHVPAVRGEDGSSLYGLHARSVHQMNQYGHGVIVGGGNIYENGALDVDPQALRALRLPLMLFSLSHGRIYDHRHQLVPRTDAMADAMVVALNKQARLSLVRDDATLAYVRALGITSAQLGGCPSLLLDDMDSGDGYAVVPPGGILISVRSPRLMSVPTRDEMRVHDTVGRLVQDLRRLDRGPVRLLCHDTRDLEFASSFDGVDYILPDDVHTYLRLLREARLVVSFRLHAFVPCVSFGTAAINLSYDERSMSLVRTIGFGAWDVDFIRSSDPARDVLERCGRLADYAALREATRTTRAALCGTMRDAAATFAQQVRRYRDSGLLG